MREIINSILEKFFVFQVSTRYPELKQAYAIHSHLTSHERYQLFKLALDKEKILEIGSYVGASATCFASARNRQRGGAVLCIDTWQNDAMTEGNRDTYRAFLENTKPFEKWIVPIRGFSTNVVEEVSSHTSTLDLLFIDGDHSYEGAKADWESYRKFLHKGSVVVFHDYGWAEGVQRVIAEDVKPLVSDFDTLPNMWWGTIGK